MAQSKLPAAGYPAARLFELLNKQELSWGEIEEYIDECFGPWIEAVRSGDVKAGSGSIVSKRLKEQGYTETFDKLTKSLKLTDENSNVSAPTGGLNKSERRYYAGRTLLTQKLNAAQDVAESEKPAEMTAAAKRLIKGKLPIDVEQYFEIAARLLRSSDPYNIAAGLMAVTGRRAIEVCYIGSFRPFNSESAPEYLPIGDAAYMVQFKGPAKKRDWDIAETERAEFCIPTLIPGDAVIKAWKLLKASAEYKAWQKEGKAIVKAKGEREARKKFNAAWEGKLNGAIADAFPIEVLPPKDDQSETATCHCFRGAYAELVNRRDNAEESINSMLFIGTTMGHYLPENDPTGKAMAKALGSTFSYLVYKVPAAQSVPFAESPLVNPSKTVRVYESEHSWLTAEQHRLNLGNQGDAMAFVRQRLNRVIELEKQLQDARSDRDKAQQQLTELQQGAEPLAATVRELREENQQLRAKAALTGQELPKVVEVAPKVAAIAEEPEKDGRRVTSVKSEQWLDRVYQTIADHNDAQGDDKWAKWALTERALKDLSGTHQDVVKRWWIANEQRLIEMHSSHDLPFEISGRSGRYTSSFNTSKARKKMGVITDAFTFERPEHLLTKAVKPVAA